MNFDDEGLKVFAILVLVVGVIATSAVINNALADYQVRMMVSGGANPVQARCAINSVSTEALCMATLKP